MGAIAFGEQAAKSADVVVANCASAATITCMLRLDQLKAFAGWHILVPTSPDVDEVSKLQFGALLSGPAQDSCCLVQISIHLHCITALLSQEIAGGRFHVVKDYAVDCLPEITRQQHIVDSLIRIKSFD